MGSGLNLVWSWGPLPTTVVSMLIPCWPVALCIFTVATEVSRISRQEEPPPPNPAISSPIQEQQAVNQSSTVVFEAAVDGYPHIRIPSILALENGDLLAFAEARQGGDHAKNDIVLKRSFDGGRTWGPLQVIDDQGGDSLNDPLPVEVRFGPHAGRVYMTYMSFPEGCHTDCVEAGYGPRSSRNWLVWSDDRGSTWTDPVEVTRTFRRESTNYAGSPGVGIQLERGPHRGRLVFPQRQGPIDAMQAYAVFSDDGGDTWQRGEPAVNHPGPGTADEISLLELEDGSILLNCRAHNGGPKRRLRSRSTDGGASFGRLEVDDGLITPHCMGSIVMHQAVDRGSEASWILYCGPWREDRRSEGAFVGSADGGKSWGPPTMLVPGEFAYSQMVVLEPGGDVGLFYEADGYRTMRFLRFNPGSPKVVQPAK